MNKITIDSKEYNEIQEDAERNMTALDNDYEFLACDLNKAGYFVFPRRIVEDHEKPGPNYKLEGNLVISPVRLTDNELRELISNSTDRDFDFEGIGGKTLITLK